MRKGDSIKYLAVIIIVLNATLSVSQIQYQERLPQDIFDVAAPSARVTGAPGDMAYLERNCRAIATDNLRQRIVNTAIQEWSYFGYALYDLTHTRDDNPDYRKRPWTRPRIDYNEAIRVADSIAGYWSSTPESAWILGRQNQYWLDRGAGSRWRDPWSAAFISWIMCESGLGDNRRFRRAIAHHSYIDQAIRARNDNESLSAYVAYDSGELPIEPGDLLCRGMRPNYKSLAARQLQMGVGARTHCDIVVKLDADNNQIMLIGGNVCGWVRLKLLPADINDNGYLEAAPYDSRRIFAHLKLQADSIPNNAFELSPSIQSLSCQEQGSLSRVVDSLNCS